MDGDGKVNIRDPLVTLAALFRRGPFSYPDAADVNDDGHIDVMDALASLEFIFRKAMSMIRVIEPPSFRLTEPPSSPETPPSSLTDVGGPLGAATPRGGWRHRGRFHR